MAIKREADDNGPEEIELHYEFSVNSLKGTSATPNELYTNIFQKNQSCPAIGVNREVILKSFASGTITIQCKLWKKQGTVIKSDHFFFKTRMRKEHCVFTGVVENFSDVSAGDMVTLKTIPSTTGESMLTVNLFFFIPDSISITFCRQIKMRIIFIAMDDTATQLCSFKMFILDSSGNKTDTGKLERMFRLESRSTGYTLPGLWQEELWEKGDQFLVNDILSLHFELSFCSGIESEKIEIADPETGSIVGVNATDFLNAVEILTSKEEIPCDTKLQTATETFPAHTSILGARSPVFDAMFKTDMQEANQKRVLIEDVDTKTVYHMLVFLYSDTLEKLEWKDAINLYFAADKYQILSMKQKCTTLLIQSLDLSNCCTLLHMAVMHHDEDLKKAVIKYIDKYYKAIVHSFHWRNLEETHPHSAINFFRVRYLAMKPLDLFSL